MSVWVLGNIDRTDTRRQSHAELIADHIENRGLVELACYSGFFLAIVGRADDTYVVSDRLGMFPCYYMTRGEVLVLGSSSYIPVLHPALHRLRFHIAGILGRIAQTVWPSAPYTHDAVLVAAGGMPAASLLARRLQKDLLTGRFPRLAALPLDSNSFFPGPLAPSIGYRLRSRVRRMTGLQKLNLQGGERRFFYRLYDMNNPGWRLVREEGLRSCDGLWGILDIDCLRELLPDTRVRIEVKDAIIDASGRKSLPAFVLWHKRYADVLAQGGPPSICPKIPAVHRFRPPIRRWGQFGRAWVHRGRDRSA